MEDDRDPAARDSQHEDAKLSRVEGEPSRAKEIFRAGSGERASEAPNIGAGAKPVSSPGWFGASFPLAAGLTGLGAAAALAAVHAQQRARGGSEESLAREVGLVLVWGTVGTLLGFLAVKGVAMWRKRPVGDTRLALSRMFAATGLFMLVLNMGIAPTGWGMLDRPVSMGLATAVYLVIVWASFRLSREDAMAVLFAHALLWLGVYGAAELAPRVWGEHVAATTPAPESSFEPPHAPAESGAPPAPVEPAATPPPAPGAEPGAGGRGAR